MCESRIQRRPRSSAKRIMSTKFQGARHSTLLNKTMKITTSNAFLMKSNNYPVNIIFEIGIVSTKYEQKKREIDQIMNKCRYRETNNCIRAL